TPPALFHSPSPRVSSQGIYMHQQVIRASPAAVAGSRDHIEDQRADALWSPAIKLPRMDLGLSGKVVIVTGGASNLGRAITLGFAAEWEREIAIDVWGFINSVRAVLDPMVQRKYGRIVSIGSDAGRMGEWREAVYSGTKASVIAMSKAIAREVGKYGITLNVVCPGLTPGSPETSGRESMWAGDQADKFTQEVLEKAAKAYPLRRIGTPEDVVPAVLLLASDRASYITGQTLSVSGGYTMI